MIIILKGLRGVFFHDPPLFTRIPHLAGDFFMRFAGAFRAGFIDGHSTGWQPSSGRCLSKGSESLYLGKV